MLFNYPHIIGRENAGYKIIATMGNYVLGHRPGTYEEWVTWYYNDSKSTDQELYCAHGNYFDNLAAAEIDLLHRAKEAL